MLERLGSDNKMVRLLLNRAKTNPKRVVFAEADQLDVLKAAQIVYDEGIAIPILLGRRDVIEELMEEIEFDADVTIIDPKSDEETERKNKYAEIYWKQNEREGVTIYSAQKIMRERNYFAAMMVNEGDADALDFWLFTKLSVSCKTHVRTNWNGKRSHENRNYQCYYDTKRPFVFE